MVLDHTLLMWAVSTISLILLVLIYLKAFHDSQYFYVHMKRYRPTKISILVKMNKKMANFLWIHGLVLKRFRFCPTPSACMYR